MHMMEVSSAFISKSHSSSTDISRRPPTTWEPEPGSVLDPFHIEDLLDFSNEDIAGPIGEELSAVTTERTVTQQHQSQSPAALEQPAANEFSIDCDEIPELEWLSSFVDDDSFGMGVFIGNKGQYSPVSNTSDNKKPEEHTNKRTHRMMLVEESSTKDTFQVGSPISVLESTSGRLANQAVPGRPRSKRARNSSNTSWNNTSSSCLLNSTTNGVSPATSSVSAEKEIVSDNAGSGSGSGSLDNNCCFEQDVVDSVPVLREQESSIVSISKMVNVSTPVKAVKPPLQVKPLQVRPATVNDTGSDVQPRRCTHCLSQKTPQWRAGPEGPKTLCNACGVRYKSGRLFPEYRPALSPTFISDVHSNSHRKVLEMRRQKEVQQRQPSSSQEVIIDGGLIYTS